MKVDAPPCLMDSFFTGAEWVSSGHKTCVIYLPPGVVGMVVYGSNVTPTVMYVYRFFFLFHDISETYVKLQKKSLSV